MYRERYASKQTTMLFRCIFGLTLKQGTVKYLKLITRIL